MKFLSKPLERLVADPTQWEFTHLVLCNLQVMARYQFDLARSDLNNPDFEALGKVSSPIFGVNETSTEIMLPGGGRIMFRSGYSGVESTLDKTTMELFHGLGFASIDLTNAHCTLTAERTLLTRLRKGKMTLVGFKHTNH